MILYNNNIENDHKITYGKYFNFFGINSWMMNNTTTYVKNFDWRLSNDKVTDLLIQDYNIINFDINQILKMLPHRYPFLLG